MATVEETPPEWRKSTACVPSECVEVARHGDHVLIRDSADVQGPVLAFSNDQWQSFARKLGFLNKDDQAQSCTRREI